MPRAKKGTVAEKSTGAGRSAKPQVHEKKLFHSSMNYYFLNNFKSSIVTIEAMSAGVSMYFTVSSLIVNNTHEIKIELLLVLLLRKRERRIETFKHTLLFVFKIE